MALSLRETRERELFLDLVATARVLIENYRPRTLEAVGLAPELLHRHNPPERTLECQRIPSVLIAR